MGETVSPVVIPFVFPYTVEVSKQNLVIVAKYPVSHALLSIILEKRKTLGIWYVLGTRSHMVLIKVVAPKSDVDLDAI